MNKENEMLSALGGKGSCSSAKRIKDVAIEILFRIKGNRLVGKVISQFLFPHKVKIV